MKKLMMIVALIAVCGFAADYTPVTKEAANTLAGVNTVSGSVVASGSGYIAATAQVSTNVTINSTLWTPKFVGQILIGTVSNVVFISEGLTTNDWIRVVN